MYLAWRDHHITPMQFAKMSDGEKMILFAFEDFRQEVRANA